MEQWKQQQKLTELRNCTYEAESALSSGDPERMIEALGKAQVIANILTVVVMCQAVTQEMLRREANSS